MSSDSTRNQISELILRVALRGSKGVAVFLAMGNMWRPDIRTP